MSVCDAFFNIIQSTVETKLFKDIFFIERLHSQRMLSRVMEKIQRQKANKPTNLFVKGLPLIHSYFWLIDI